MVLLSQLICFSFEKTVLTWNTSALKNSATIIPVSTPDCQVNSWKNTLKSAFSDSEQLLDYLQIEHSHYQQQNPVQSNFPLRVPLPFADKMKKGDINDPLLLQVLAKQLENQTVEGYSFDPLKEQQNTMPGLLHKYAGRVLLILTGACAVNCRYCFRRHFPYEQQLANGENLDKNLKYIENDATISEVILSGGDPLLISDGQLEQLISRLEKIKHLTRLRIHSRLPIVIPQRLTSSLRRCLSETRLQTSLVIHANHSNEIDDVLGERLTHFVQSGISLFNQSVLLKNINDNPKTLARLSEKLFEFQVIPYYIHQLDPVAGAAHFDIDKNRALEIMRQLGDLLPGYLLSKFVVEEPEKACKTVIL